MARASASSSRSWRAPILLALGVLVVDQLTKDWAIDRLSGGRTIDLVWTLRFNLAFNSGMAFSQAEGFGPLIAVVATLVIVWLLVSLRTVGGALSTFGIGCVLGGAAGNLADRAFRQEGFLRGSVVDFIDLRWFPIFNGADVAINVGAGALILGALLASRHERLEPAGGADGAIDGASDDDPSHEGTPPRGDAGGEVSRP